MDSRTEGAFEKLLGRFVDLRPLIRLLEDADVLISVGRLLVYCTAIGLGAFLLAGVALGSVIAMILALISGMAAPVGYLTFRRNKRETALVSQLPDAVDMISRGLRAGQGLDAALQEVARSFPAPVGTELKRIYEEMTMGMSFESAVRGFEMRFHRVTDVRMLCAALLIQRETGGNLTTILDNIAHTIRERFTFFRQVRALSAEGRLSATILGSLPILFCIIIWIVRPEHIRLLFTDPAGKKLIMLVIVLELAGFLVMFRLAKVKA
jgi:tight adherence protein B